MIVHVTDFTRRPPGAAEGGQFARKTNSPPLDGLGSPRPRTIARAGAEDTQVVYERDDDSGFLRVVVLGRDDELSKQEGADAWVEEGSVLTSTPASSDISRIGSVAASQVTRLARELDSGADPAEVVDAFLADLADRRDPFITRGSRRRHGEELEDAPWPDLDVAG